MMEITIGALRETARRCEMALSVAYPDSQPWRIQFVVGSDGVVYMSHQHEKPKIATKQVYRVIEPYMAEMNVRHADGEGAIE